MSTAPLPPTDPDGAADLLEAVGALLRPLARLVVARGVTYPVLDQALKTALVAAAREAHADLPAQRSVSRISTTLGMNRREVTRWVHEGPASAPPRATPAQDVFARWRSDPSLRDPHGQPLSLPRTGPAPSFEALARSVTLNVHPRSLLDELCRLGLAHLDVDADRVELRAEAFVPRGDAAAMLGFVADNVGDHLSAAVENVLGDGRQHFEQAVFADELSAQSLAAFRAWMGPQWQALLRDLVPLLENLIEQDRRAGRPQNHRLRLGMYSYMQQTAPETPVAAPAPKERRLGSRKTRTTSSRKSHET
jgi:hypothetical protein